MYGGNIACIPVNIPTKFSLNWLKISHILGYTLTCGQLQDIGQLLGQSL